MKGSPFKMIVLLTVLIVLVSIPGATFVKAQVPNGTGDEVSRPASSLPPKVPGQVGGLDVAWRWYTTAGATFIPDSNAMTWTYAGSGCVHPSTSGGWRASVNIPDGSTLTYLHFGFYNYASSTATTAGLWRYSSIGDAAPVKQLSSNPGSSTTGFAFVGGDIPVETVDNLDNAHAFVWNGANPSSVPELCYIQVGYVPPSIFGVALPLVAKTP